jgi:hypothetical protein
MTTAQMILIAHGLPEFELVKMMEKSLIDCKRSRKIEDLALVAMLILHKCAVKKTWLNSRQSC